MKESDGIFGGFLCKMTKMMMEERGQQCIAMRKETGEWI
jgi:hypothetical protein